MDRQRRQFCRRHRFATATLAMLVRHKPPRSRVRRRLSLGVTRLEARLPLCHHTCLNYQCASVMPTDCHDEFHVCSCPFLRKCPKRVALSRRQSHDRKERQCRFIHLPVAAAAAAVPLSCRVGRSRLRLGCPRTRLPPSTVQTAAAAAAVTCNQLLRSVM